MKVLNRILEGYARVGSWVLGALVLVAAAALVGVVIVLPLWLAATRLTTVYTVVVLVVLAGALLTWIIRGIRAQSRSSFLPILKAAGRLVGAVAVVYAVFALFAAGFLVPAAGVAVAGLLWLGYAASRGGTKTDAEDET